MAERIELPQTPSGSSEEQLRQMYSYLYRMAQAMNHNLSEIGSMDLTDDEREVMKQITAEEEGQAAAGYDWQGKESLKSLIIKTAAFVQNSLNSYRINLLGEYVAEGKFGRYVRNTGLKVDVTPEGIQQNFTFEEVVQGLKTYEINAKNYIKTGLLRTVSSIPVYGVAIGKDVVTFAEDGTETYNDGNKVAELTADELSFYQGANKVASYTGSKLSFMQGGSEVFYISAGKLYSATDFEIKSGKKLIVDMTNFKLDSSGNLTITGGGTFSGALSAATGTFAGNLSAAGGTFAGTMSAACVTSGTMSADRISGGTIDASVTNVTNLNAGNITTGTMSANKISGGSIDASNVTINNLDASKITTGTMSASKIKGGTLTLGGDNNENGTLVMKNASGTTIGEWNKDGFSASGGTFDVDYTNFKIDSGNKYLKTGDWEINSDGILYDYDLPRAFGEPQKKAQFFIRNSGIDYSPSGDIYKTGINYGFSYGNAGGTVYYFPNITLFEELPDSGVTGFINFSTSTVNGQPMMDVTGTKLHLGASMNNAIEYIYTKNLYYNRMIQDSSKSIKHDIADMPDMGGQLDRLRPVTFVYDDDPEERTRYGLIYEETEEVMPEICTGDEGAKAINYVEMIPMLLKEIQDLRARVKALEEREEA